MAYSAVRADLLLALGQIQNHPACCNQDIMTFTAFMNDGEVKDHIDANMARVARWSETQHKWKRKR
jgi:hypothetical protein